MFTSSQRLRVIWENLLFAITVTLPAHSHLLFQTSNSLGNNSGLGCNECLQILYHRALGLASEKDRVIVAVSSVPQLLRASACPEFDICHDCACFFIFCCYMEVFAFLSHYIFPWNVLFYDYYMWGLYWTGFFFFFLSDSYWDFGFVCIFQFVGQYQCKS